MCFCRADSEKLTGQTGGVGGLDDSSETDGCLLCFPCSITGLICFWTAWAAAFRVLLQLAPAPLWSYPPPRLRPPLLATMTPAPTPPAPSMRAGSSQGEGPLTAAYQTLFHWTERHSSWTSVYMPCWLLHRSSKGFDLNILTLLKMVSRHVCFTHLLLKCKRLVISTHCVVVLNNYGKLDLSRDKSHTCDLQALSVSKIRLSLWVAGLGKERPSKKNLTLTCRRGDSEEGEDLKHLNWGKYNRLVWRWCQRGAAPGHAAMSTGTEQTKALNRMEHYTVNVKGATIKNNLDESRTNNTTQRT